MSTRHVFYRRRFLNRPRYHLGAHVIADVEMESSTSGRSYINASLRLADCNRVVDLDFSAGTAREAANALYKLRVLREVLSDFEAGLEAAVAQAGAPQRV